MYKAIMIASAVVHKDHAERLESIAVPVLSTICNEVTVHDEESGSHIAFGEVTDQNFEFEDRVSWCNELLEELDSEEYSSVHIKLYLTDESGTEYWADKVEDGIYIIYVDEDAGTPVCVVEDEVEWVRGV